MKPLPPYGRKFLADLPTAGLCVAIGSHAWRFAKARPYPVLVLPTENMPTDFLWPFHPNGSVIFEVGDFDDDRLTAIARELLKAGCPFVVAIREALMSEDPRVFFYGEDHANKPA